MLAENLTLRTIILDNNCISDTMAKQLLEAMKNSPSRVSIKLSGNKCEEDPIQQDLLDKICEISKKNAEWPSTVVDGRTEVEGSLQKRLTMHSQ